MFNDMKVIVLFIVSLLAVLFTAFWVASVFPMIGMVYFIVGFVTVMLIFANKFE
jgi:hypothetical protein